MTWKSRIFGANLSAEFARKNLSEFGWLLGGQGLSMLLGLVSVKLLTSMGTTEFGKYALALTLSAFVSAVYHGPAEQAFVRFQSVCQGPDERRLFGDLLRTFVSNSAFAFSALVLLFSILVALLGVSDLAILSLCVGLLVIATSTTNLLSAMLNVVRQRKSNAMIQVAEKVSIICLLLLTITYFRLDASIALLAYAIAGIVSSFGKYMLIKRVFPTSPRNYGEDLAISRRNLIRSMLRFSAPFVIWGIAAWLQQNSERWVIAQYLSTADVGVFALLATLANVLVSTPSGLLSQFAIPFIYGQFADLSRDDAMAQGRGYVKALVIAVLGVVIVSTILTATLGEQIILLISSSKYSVQWYLLPILCLGVGSFNIGQALTVVGLSMNTPQRYLKPKIILGLLSVAANVGFIVWLGLLGIVLASCFVGIVYIILVVLANSPDNSKPR